MHCITLLEFKKSKLSVQNVIDTLVVLNSYFTVEPINNRLFNAIRRQWYNYLWNSLGIFYFES